MKSITKLNSNIGLSLTNKDIPKINHDEVLIKVYQVAICGTDIHIYDYDDWAKENVKIPLTIGHEFSGHIVEIGKNVKSFEIGDFVTAESHITSNPYSRFTRCGLEHIDNDISCIGVSKDGAFAEFIKISARNVWKPYGNIDKNILTLFDPIGNAVHSIFEWDILGKNILITGAGPIGIISGIICQHLKAKKVILTDKSPYRIELAKKLGLNCIQSDEILKIMKDDKIDNFDIGLEMSGNINALNSMIDVLRPTGKISLLGIFSQKDIHFDWNKVIFKSLEIRGIYGRKIFDTWYKMNDLLLTGLDLSGIITHKYHFTEYEKAFQTMKEKKCGKIILQWGENE